MLLLELLDFSQFVAFGTHCALLKALSSTMFITVYSPSQPSWQLCQFVRCRLSCHSVLSEAALMLSKKNKKTWRAIVFQALGKVWWREKIVHTVCVNAHVFINFRATIWQWYKNGRWICWTELLSSFYLSLIVARNLTQLYVRLFIYVNYLLCIQPDFWNKNFFF